MKNIFIVFFLFVCFFGFSQEVLYRTSATLQWNDVTTDASGDPLLPTDIVTYDIYMYDSAVGIPIQIFMGNTANNELELIFPERKTWIAGVRTRIEQGDGTIGYSVISWSNDPLVVETAPFVYAPLLSTEPEQPRGLSDSQM